MADTSETEIEPYLEIIELIASQNMADQVWWQEQHERRYNVVIQKNISKAKKKAEWKAKAEKLFPLVIKDYAQGKYFNRLNNEFYPFDPRLDWNDPSHPVREIQEAYLMVMLDIEVSASSSENWAAIGMKLAVKETKLSEILNPPREEKRGRRAIGAGVDYERAVWRYMVDRHSLELSNDYYDDDWPLGTVHSLSEILDAYLFALNNPDFHPYEDIFQWLEKKLKIKGKSRNSLLVAFNRGEKQRDALWND